jgi:hypothetical protein
MVKDEEELARLEERLLRCASCVCRAEKALASGARYNNL